MDGGVDSPMLSTSVTSMSSSSPSSFLPTGRSGQKRERDLSDDILHNSSASFSSSSSFATNQESSQMSALNAYSPSLGAVATAACVSPNGSSSSSNNNNNHLPLGDVVQETAKKAKLDETQTQAASESPDATRVVHLRNVNAQVPEQDVIQLGLPFGKITNMLALKNKNQAFLEFGDTASAVTMVNFYNNANNRVQPMLGGKPIYVQFSQHKELRTSMSHSNANAQTQAAIQAAQAVTGGVEDGSGVAAGSRRKKSDHPGSQNEPSPVLRIMIENMIYPITLDTLLLIFNKYGQVLKIVTFTKNNLFQSLIQYDSSASGEAAKKALNGQNIYNGCCTLRVDFSRMDQLHVKYNNDKSRDLTNIDLPSGTDTLPANHRAAMSGAPGILASTPFAAGLGSGGGGNASNNANIGHNFNGVHSMNNTSVSNAQGSGNGAINPTGNPLLASALQSIAGLNQGVQNALLASLTQQLGAAPGAFQPRFNQGGFGSNNVNQPTTSGANTFSGGLVGSAPAGGAGSVLLVSGLNETDTTCDGLFTIFGVYADVLRVKILYNKKDNALVQVADSTQAAVAMTHLDKIKVWGKPMRVAASKHAQVQMPKEGAPDGGLTKDFANSPLHRFKKKGSKNYSNIFAPSATLHLSNIPPTTTEEELLEAFGKHASVKGFKFFPKDRKMALISLESVEQAVNGLIHLHNFQLAENSHLRVSFSKSSLN